MSFVLLAKFVELAAQRRGKLPRNKLCTPSATCIVYSYKQGYGKHTGLLMDKATVGGVPPFSLVRLRQSHE